MAWGRGVNIKGPKFGAEVTCTSDLTDEHRVRFYWLRRDGSRCFSESVRRSVTCESKQQAVGIAERWARVRSGSCVS